MEYWPTGFMWNFEQFLCRKYQLFKLKIVKNSKKIKKVLPKDENFQISEHQFPLCIEQLVCCENLASFYILNINFLNGK